jgi:hypothetical protein
MSRWGWASMFASGPQPTEQLWIPCSKRTNLYPPTACIFVEKKNEMLWWAECHATGDESIIFSRGACSWLPGSDSDLVHRPSEAGTYYVGSSSSAITSLDGRTPRAEQVDAGRLVPFLGSEGKRRATWHGPCSGGFRWETRWHMVFSSLRTLRVGSGRARIPYMYHCHFCSY